MELRPPAGRHPAQRAKVSGDAHSAGQIGPGVPPQPMTFTPTAVGAPILVGHGKASQRASPAAAVRTHLDAAVAWRLIERHRQRGITDIGVDDGGGRP